ncbi:hypothetical protein KB553_11825 [Chryseobacterium rhizoplanae]|uniref:hypothetical protein n=1 Tax=Chryseobacterium TaxID=59732 RepID=UPI001CE34704|nr:hypothetical protein [Chryseobacterium rhizoplanae]UCA57751.1 hypothetical protein KB553_11825 [Chryseobacterium rhizoplanae]
MYLLTGNEILFKSNDIITLFFQKEKYNDYADQIENLLDEAIESIDIADYSFYSGIAGLGWLIEFCKEKKIIRINTESSLADFDDQIYKFTIHYLSQDNTDYEVLFDLFNYYYARMRSKNENSDINRTFSLFVCGNLIVRKINVQKIEPLLADKRRLQPEELLFISAFTLKLTYISELSGFASDILLFQIFENVFTYFEQEYSTLDEDYLLSILLLLASAKQAKNKVWEKKMLSHYHTLKSRVSNHKESDDIVLLEEIIDIHFHYQNPQILLNKEKYCKFLCFYLLNFSN